MANISDRLREVAFTKEAVRDTADGPDAGDYVAHQQHTIKPMTDKVYHNGVKGSIGSVNESAITGERVEGQVPTTLEQSKLWLYGAAVCGQDPSTTGSSPYVHTYLLDTDSNIHQSFTVSYTDPNTGDKQAANGMFTNIELNVVPNEYPTVAYDIIAGKESSDTATPSYVASPNYFTAAQCTVKEAANYAGLSGASAFCTTNIRLTVNKNVEGLPCNGSTEFAEIVNKDFDIRGEFEMEYDSTTFRGYDLNNDTRAIEFEVTDGTYGMVIQLPSVTFEGWDDPSGDNSMVKQRITFVANAADATNGYVQVIVTDATATH